MNHTNSRIWFAILLIAGIALASCSANRSDVPRSLTSHDAQHIAYAMKGLVPRFIPPSPGRRTAVHPEATSSPLGNIWDGNTDDVCPSSYGYSCSAAGEQGSAGGIEYPSASASCAPIDYTITSYTPNSGYTPTLVPASGITNAPPFLIGIQITVSGSQPPSPGAAVINVSASSATCSLGQPSPTKYFILCGYIANNCPAAAIDDVDLNKLVSASPIPSASPIEIPWAVGALKTLKVASAGGNGPYTTRAIQWALPINVASSYNFGTTPQLGPSPVATTAAQQATIKYFWLAGNNSVPQVFSAQMDILNSSSGEEAVPTGIVSYLVEIPTVSATSAVQPVQVGPYSGNTIDLSLGTGLHLPQSAGIKITYSATMPTISQGAGYIGLSQLITSAVPIDGLKFPALDGCPINDATPSPAPTSSVLVIQGPIKVAAGAKGSVSTFDAPGTALAPADSPFTELDNFIDYLMYRPVGKNSIWVNLGNVVWSWGGTATYYPNATPSPDWKLSSPTQAAPSTSIGSAAEPTWQVTNPPLGDGSCPGLPSQ